MPPFIKTISKLIAADITKNYECDLAFLIEELRCVREAGDQKAIRHTTKAIRTLKRYAGDMRTARVQSSQD